MNEGLEITQAPRWAPIVPVWMQGLSNIDPLDTQFVDVLVFLEFFKSLLLSRAFRRPAGVLAIALQSSSQCWWFFSSLKIFKSVHFPPFKSPFYKLTWAFTLAWARYPVTKTCVVFRSCVVVF